MDSEDDAPKPQNNETRSHPTNETLPGEKNEAPSQLFIKLTHNSVVQALPRARQGFCCRQERCQKTQQENLISTILDLDPDAKVMAHI
jgi:hypothetical protein